MGRDRKGRPTTLKFPVLSNVEYVSILKNKKSVFESNEGKEFEGMTRREFQMYLGERLPQGIYYHIIKFKNSGELYQGTIRTVKTGISKEENEMDEGKILKEFQDLKKSLDKATDKGGISFEMLLASTKQGYEAQIQYKDSQIADKDKKIEKLEAEIDELENELDDCEKQASQNSGLSSTIDVVQKFLAIKTGNVKPVTTLKESDQTDIPGEVLQVLGMVDWQKIDDASYQKIVAGLKQYITFLPLKGQ